MNRIHKKLHLAVCAALTALVPTLSYAAPAENPNPSDPSAGQLLQQIERDLIVKPLPVQPVIEEAQP